MKKLCLKVGLSYTMKGFSCKAGIPFDINDEKAAMLLETGRFEEIKPDVIVDEEGGDGEPDGSEDKDPGKKLKDMTVQEMETCAAYHGISLNGLTKKADIIAKISEELGVDPKDAAEYGSPTMQDLMEQ